MSQSILNILRKKYQKHYRNNNNSQNCIKLHYQYNCINVNLYFDAYDINLPAAFMILTDKKLYYITSLNVNHLEEKNQYIDEIPNQLLEKIKDKNNKLATFYDDMRKHIRNDEFRNTTYNDIIFKNTVKYNKHEENNPFFYHLREVHMTSKQFNKLFSNLNISKETLIKVQKEGFTIVTTSDPSKRKDFYEELKNKGIQLR